MAKKKDKRAKGNNTKWSDTLRRELLVQLALESDERACRNVGITRTTLHRWCNLSESGDARYSWEEQQPTGVPGETVSVTVTLSDAVQRARGERRDAVLARLARYHDYRADDKYLTHTNSRDLGKARKRKAEADADIAEATARKVQAEAAVAEALANKADGGGLIMVGVDRILEMLHNAGRPDVADVVEQTLVAQEVSRLGWRSDILPREGEGDE